MIYLEMTVRLEISSQGDKKFPNSQDLADFHDDIKEAIDRVYDEVGFTSDDFSVEGFTVSAPVRMSP